MLVSLGWLAIGAVPVMDGLQRAGVSPTRQLQLVLTHPLHAVLAGMRTLHVFGPTLVREVIGVLGLLDTLLPASFYGAAILCLGCAIGVALWPSTRPSALPVPMRGSRAAIAVVLAGSAILIFALFYLVWTPVSALLIEGVQGRYLLPPFLFAVLLLPSHGPDASLPPGQRRLACAFMLLSWCVVPAIVLARYPA
jgi:uncharacterized membrane protein